MATYNFTKASVRAGQLHREIVNASLPTPTGINHNESTDSLDIEFSVTLTSGQETTLSTTVTNHTPSFASATTNRLSSDHINGARMTWVSVSQISFGTTGNRSEVRDANNEVDIFWSGILTVDFTTTGIGGLDSGPVQSNTWYRIFVLADELGINSVGVMATSSASPSLPDGYSHFRRLGWVKTDGSGNIFGFRQKGSGNIRDTYYDVPLATLRVLNAGSATTFAIVDLSNHVPESVSFVYLNVGISTATDTSKLTLRPKNVTATGAQIFIRPGIISVSSMLIPLEMTIVDQGIEYKVDNASDEAVIVVLGYQDEL